MTRIRPFTSDFHEQNRHQSFLNGRFGYETEVMPRCRPVKHISVSGGTYFRSDFVN